VIALVTPYAAYVVAEDLGASGVTAVVVAGIVLGGSGHKLSDAPIRLHVHAVYSTVVFLLESVVFAIIGLQLPALVRQLAPNEHAWPLWALGVAVTVLTVRVLWIFPVSTLMQHRRGAERISWRTPAVLSWAGTRGVMPLAAALSIPLTTHSGAPLPYRPLILVLTTGVVVLSLVIQGLTLAPVVRRAGIALEPEHTAREEARARESLARAALAELGQLAELDVAPAVVVDQARRHLQSLAERTPVEARDSEAHKALRLALISAQSAELWRLYESNDVSDTTRRRLQRALDLEEAGLNDA
jgi:monovalent cation/hydrogen antiporter